MKLKFLHSIACSEWSHPPGKVIDFHDDEMGAKFIASGIAVSAEPEVIAPEVVIRPTKKR